MGRGFLARVQELVQESDIIVEMLDARFPEETRHKAIENKVKASGKKLLIVMNKADLCEKKYLENKKKQLEKETRTRTIFISAKEKDGINLLRKELAMMKTKKERTVVAIVGYPNSGKSSMINALSGKGGGRVRVSRKAGFTRGVQLINLGENFYIFDSPGVIPFGNRDEYQLFLVGAKNANQLKDMEGTALMLVKHFGKEKLAKKFGKTVLEANDENEILEKIAIEKKFFRKGALPDTQRAAREFLEVYQRNEI